MKALIYTRYGGPENLQYKEIAAPVPNDNEVLINVHAVSINDWDYQLLYGDFVNRLLNGFFKPKKQILGCDIAGTITAIGNNVTKFKMGDEVYGDLSGRWGGFAEFVCAEENEIIAKPAAMSFEEAAAIPQAGMLALQGLRDKRELQRGQKVLINGAGGGVGTFAIQLAKLCGAEITGVDHSEKLELMRSLGCDRVVDYELTDFTKENICYDYILDVKTMKSVREVSRALCRGGMYATAGGSIKRLLQILFLKSLISKFQNKRLEIIALKRNRDLGYFNELYTAGKLKPVLDRTYNFQEAVEAMKKFGSGKHKGKIVIRMNG